MLSIIETRICYKNTQRWGCRREGAPFRLLSDSGALTPITRPPLSPRTSTQNTTLSFLLFIVIVCFEAQTVRRQCASRCGPMGAFKCPKAVICLIHSLLPLKVGLCRHLTELGAFRFGSGQFAESGRVLSTEDIRTSALPRTGRSHLNGRLMDSFSSCFKRFCFNKCWRSPADITSETKSFSSGRPEGRL